MEKTRIECSLGLLVALMLAAGPAQAADLVIWHDKGDDGLAMIDAMAAEFQKTHPDVTVRSITMPTEQWISKSIAAVNTKTGPDILFNDNNRLATVQQSTGKLCPLTDVVNGLPAGDRAFISDGDLTAATFDGQVIMMPFQRVITAWGARKSWLEKLGENYPTTWSDMLRIAKLFQTQDPDGNGQNDTYGFALQGGGAGSLIGAGSKLFVMSGNRAPHDLMDSDGRITIADANVAKPTEEYLKVYTDYKLVAPDTINHTFTDMYQLIEGGRVGFFRVGNWNVGKWDREALKGDYVVGPLPSFDEGVEGAMLVGTVRGMSIPCNGANVDLAKEFVASIVGKQQQQDSLAHMGGIVRNDLDTSGVTPGLVNFVNGKYPMQTDDFMASTYPWFPALIDDYYTELSGAIASPPADWNAWFTATAAKLQVKADAELNK